MFSIKTGTMNKPLFEDRLERLERLISSSDIADKLERIERIVTANKKVLNFDEACVYTGISRSYMYKLTAGRKIPHAKPCGKIIFFDKEKLDEWLIKNSSKTLDELDENLSQYYLSLKKKKA